MATRVPAPSVILHARNSPNLRKNLVRWFHANMSARPAHGGRRGGILSLLRRAATGAAAPGRHHRWYSAIQEEPAVESGPGRPPVHHSRPPSLVCGGTGEGAGLRSE